MSSMKHSMAEAIEIQKAFEHRFASQVLSVGIGLNGRQDDLALNVCVTERSQAAELPGEFDGLDVVVDVVDGFKAF